MAFVERGAGPSILLLHGNPTSSYLWREVIPPLQYLGRCIAPDLIGMGDSAKLSADDAVGYRFIRHRQFLDTFLDTVDIGSDVTLVGHDWGGALAFDWARRHPGRVKALAYMETLVRPYADWDDFQERSRARIQALRTPAGEEMILDQNLTLEKSLPAGVLRELLPEELAEYRRPYRRPEDRRPILQWPREIPVGGEPADVDQICTEYGRWLANTPGLPKLFINAEPGSMLTGGRRDFARSWPDQTEFKVPGIHFVQEDSGAVIGQAIADWLSAL